MIHTKYPAVQLSLVCVLACLLAGCQGTSTVGKDGKNLARPKYRTKIVGRSVENRPIVARVYGDGDDVVLLMASIHGNEAAGTPILDRLGKELMDNPQWVQGRTVVLLPMVNPDGVKAGKRHNTHGVDLNRNFPAGNFDGTDRHGNEPLSQPESRIILDVIERYQPSRIVSFHQPLECVDYDGEGAQAIAEAMGAHTDLPVKRLGGRPGSLGSYFGLDKGIPCITFELPRNAKDMPDVELWDRYGRATVAAVVYPETLEAK